MKTSFRNRSLVLIVVLSLWCQTAHAYIGPGLATGTVVAILGVLIAFGMLAIAVIWYPIKRLLAKNKNAEE